MIIFKYFGRITLRRKSELITPFLIFIAFMFLAVASSSSDYTEFKRTTPRVAITNHDSKIGVGLLEYLEGKVEFVDVAPENFDKAIFYRQVLFTLEIPENYTQQFLDTGVTLDANILLDSSNGYIAQNYINEYLNYYSGLTLAGHTHDEIQTMIMETRADAPSVVIESNGTADESDIFRTYSNMSGYPYLITVLSIIVIVLVTFDEKRVLARTKMSSLKLSERNFYLLSASLIVGHALWIVMTGISYLFMRQYINPDTYGWSVLNSYMLFLVAMALAFLISKVAKTASAQSAIINSVALGSSFISGVFVPQELLAPVVVNASKFLPMYWNVHANTMIYNKTLSFQDLGMSLLIQFVFSIVIVLIAVIVSKRQSERIA